VAEIASKYLFAVDEAAQIFLCLGVAANSVAGQIAS
jgi:hypothetical protein